MTTRRKFVTSALGGIGLLGLFLKSERVPAKSNRRIDSIGLQLYTVRKELEKDFESTLHQVAAISYRKVEFAGYYNRSFPNQTDLEQCGVKLAFNAPLSANNSSRSR